MKTTKNGNIKIEVNPERKYQGQFVGYTYYKLEDVRRAFSFMSGFASINEDGFDLGLGANNADMIMYHVQPYRSCGYIVE